MKKILSLVIGAMLVFSLVGCSGPGTDVEKTEDTGGDSLASESGKDISLEDVNEFLNTSADLGSSAVGNHVEVIPYKHIDGGKTESDLYAFVNFQYEGRDFIKYQVAYVSCTCRSAAVNYWQTAYVELSLPDSKNPDDVVLRNISFDADPSGEYLGGLWADSSPTPTGVTYDTFKEEFLPFFEGKENTYLKNLSTIDDIDLEDYKEGEGREDLEVDTFSGSSVSADNIIRITNAIMEYHAENEFFQ